MFNCGYLCLCPPTPSEVYFGHSLITLSHHSRSHSLLPHPCRSFQSNSLSFFLNVLRLLFFLLPNTPKKKGRPWGTKAGSRDRPESGFQPSKGSRAGSSGAAFQRRRTLLISWCDVKNNLPPIGLLVYASCFLGVGSSNSNKASISRLLLL